MKLKTTLFGNVYQFKDVKEVLERAEKLHEAQAAAAAAEAGSTEEKAGVVGNDRSGHPQ